MCKHYYNYYQISCSFGMFYTTVNKIFDLSSVFTQKQFSYYKQLTYSMYKSFDIKRFVKLVKVLFKNKQTNLVVKFLKSTI